MLLVVAIVAEPVLPDGRVEVDAAVALFAATDAFAATSIARPIVAKDATLRIVATMRARAAACGRRAIGQPPTGPVRAGVAPATVLVPETVVELVPMLVPVIVCGGAAATPLAEVPVWGGAVPMPVPGWAGLTPPCCGMVPHCPSSGPSSPHPPGEVGYVGAVGGGADWYTSCEGLAVDRAPIAQPIPRKASAPAMPAAAWVVLLVPRALGSGVAAIVDSLSRRV
jgi:hypothetical protein